MEKLIIFILATTGLTWILCDSKIFKPFRELISKKRILNKHFIVIFLDEIFNCHACMGVWSGAFCYPILYCVAPMWLLFSFIGSFVSMVLIAIFNMIKRM